MTSTQTLGAALKVARELKKLSLRDVEQACGMSNAYLSQVENDKARKPSPFFLHKLSKLYSIDYETLMTAAGYLDRTPREGQPKTLAGAALFGQEKLTAEEEEELARYLAYLRTKRK